MTRFIAAVVSGLTAAALIVVATAMAGISATWPAACVGVVAVAVAWVLRRRERAS